MIDKYLKSLNYVLKTMRKLSHSQNFIKNSNLVKRLLNLPEVYIEPGDLVLEIGPGSGIITENLLGKLSKEGRLIGVEIDSALYKKLGNRFGNHIQLELYNRDFLKFNLPAKPFKVFSNIPFNYTADILEKLLNPVNQMSCAYLIMQEDAFINYAGSSHSYKPNTSLKSLITYPFYQSEELYKFDRKDFIPEPSVKIILVSFVKREKPLVDLEKRNLYMDFISTIVKDRIGEGVWRSIFTKKQIEYMTRNYNLKLGKGISIQKPDSILSVFKSFLNLVDDKRQQIIRGNMKKLKKLESKLEKQYRTK